MTPRPDAAAGKTTGNNTKSGNPSRQASIKDQRAQQRAAKVEAYKKEQARKDRNRRIIIGSSIIAAVAVVALVVATIVLTAPKSGSYQAGTDNSTIEGVKTFKNTNGHVETPVTYPQTPPAGGEHHPYWLNCGIYEQQVPNENAVHSLEHGAVWVTYKPGLSEEDLKKIKEQLPSTYVILAPYEGLDSTLVLSAWNAQLKLDSVTDKRIPQFFEKYWKSEKVPEPGSACTGAIDGPGKVG